MDAFFVEVERLARPELRGIPLVVGGLGGRGVVATASYEARRYGVHSAMPMAHARRLCPHARFISPDHARYSRASELVFELLEGFTPLVEAVSIDEAFLDVSGLRYHYPDGLAVGEEIRRTMQQEVGLPASVGVATNKFLAKLASQAAKPNGVLQVVAGQERAFLHPRPLRDLWGVGEATQAALERLGVTAIGELAALSVSTMERKLGSLGRHLWELANGIDLRRVEPHWEAKTLSVEETYEVNLIDPALIQAELVRHSDRLSRRLRKAGLAARTILLKVRFGDFTTITRSETLAAPTDLYQEMLGAVKRLGERSRLGTRPVRLLGVGASGLVGGGAPRQLTTEHSANLEAIASAVDRVRERFGEESIGRG